MPPIDFEDMAKDAFDEIKSTLGIEATYIPKIGAPITLSGIFDDRAQEVDPDTEIPIDSNVYTFGVKDDDLPASAPEKGDTIIIKTIQYHVIRKLEDGVPGASTVLVLHRKSGAQ